MSYSTINPDTGLASVPAGYFWRVTLWGGSKSYQVQLWRKWLGVVPIPVRAAFTFFDAPDELPESSIFAFSKIAENIRRKELTRANRHVLGNYPPNRAPTAQTKD